MRADWLDPLVRIVASWFDDSAPETQYQRFVRKSVAHLTRAVGSSTHQRVWAAEFSLALDNFQQTSFAIPNHSGGLHEGSLDLPSPQQNHDWLDAVRDGGLIVGGNIERFSAMNLLALLSQGDQTEMQEIRPLLDVLLRHVELRRKGSLRLRTSQRASQRWFEVHDSAILLARSARIYTDLRYLNAALKLNDWALPVHRRSVPVDLLARYLLAVSEVQLAVEALL